MRLSGPLDVRLLQSSMNAVVERHESLRTRFVVLDGEPRQEIDTARERQFAVVDLTRIPRRAAAREAARLAEEFMQEKMDLTVGPLFDARVLRISEYEHLLLLALDHMISDGTSFAILSSEIWTLYGEALLRVPTSRLAPLRLQFPDYAVWQQAAYGAWLNEDSAYWREHLAGARGVRLPSDGIPTTQCETKGTMLHASLGDRLSSHLRQLADRMQVRLPTVMLAVYAATAARWCDERDLVIGSVSHGRHDPALSGIIGFLANRMFVRVQLSDRTTHLDLLQQVHQVLRAGAQHRDCDWVSGLLPDCTATELYFNWLPTSATQQWLPANCTLNWLPADWRVVFGDAQDATHRMPRMRAAPLRHYWPLKFAPVACDTPAGITMTIMYRPDLISTGTVERFLALFRSFAVAFAAQSQR